MPPNPPLTRFSLDHRTMDHRALHGRLKQRGAVAILVGILLVVLLGLGALAVDLGHLYVVRAELQNAADASALAGAQCLYKRNAACGNACTVSATNSCPLPDWNTAVSRVTHSTTGFIAKYNLNSDGAPLSTATVETGYWDSTVKPGSSRSSGFQTLPVSPVKVTDFPALRVTIDRATGSNGGEVTAWFARIFGVASTPVAARSVAIVTGTSTAGAGSLFPLAIKDCLFTDYWDATLNQPKLVPIGTTSLTTSYGTTIPETPGTPYEIWITSQYSVSGCEAGQWTTLENMQNGSNDENTLRDLIKGTTAPVVSINQDIYVPTGKMSNIYDSKTQESIATCLAGNVKGQPIQSCQYVNVAVVSDIKQGKGSNVLAFACLHILGVDQYKSNPYVRVELSNGANCPPISNTGGGTPGPINYGQTTPPRLAL